MVAPFRRGVLAYQTVVSDAWTWVGSGGIKSPLCRIVEDMVEPEESSQTAIYGVRKLVKSARCKFVIAPEKTNEDVTATVLTGHLLCTLWRGTGPLERSVTNLRELVYKAMGSGNDPQQHWAVLLEGEVFNAQVGGSSNTDNLSIKVIRHKVEPWSYNMRAATCEVNISNVYLNINEWLALTLTPYPGQVLTASADRRIFVSGTIETRFALQARQASVYGPRGRGRRR